jgi:hypothetical protein
MSPRKPSVRIPPPLLAYQWSDRHGPENLQQPLNIVMSPSIYSPRDEIPADGGLGTTQLSRVGQEPTVQYRQAHEDDPEIARRQDAMTDSQATETNESHENQPTTFQRTGLHTIYDQSSATNSRLELSNNGQQPLRIETPSRSPNTSNTNELHDDTISFQNNRRQTRRRSSILQTPIEVAEAAFNTVANVASGVVRRTTTWRARKEALRDRQGYARIHNAHWQRNTFVQVLFQLVFYLVLTAIVYFVFVGIPLWRGTTWYMYQLLSKMLVLRYGYTIFIGVAAIYAFLPLLIFFEKYPEKALPLDDPQVTQTALIIPCYKSAGLIEHTVKMALKVFPPQNIFVIANGNSPEPLDNTAEVVAPYGVNHIWSPVGSKIVAQFVGCYAAEKFKFVLLIDDDCALPPNFPIVSDRLKGKVKCLGYTIKSVGLESSKGTYCQQAQDLEYKLSGLQRAIAGKMGSCTFAHGAIALWNRKFLIDTFNKHPGFSVSEDWFFGNVARKLGSRIIMCTSVFVETETPSAIFFSSGGSRGGFGKLRKHPFPLCAIVANISSGEMTIWKQRFFRWNFFFVNGIFYNVAYILFSWNLGFWEIGTKIFVFQEVYETLLYILAPFVLPMSFMINPSFTGIMTGVTSGVYLINAVAFNEIHLRLKKERVSWACIAYYMWYKFVLIFVNILSCYW